MSKFENLLKTKYSHLSEAEGYQPLATQSQPTAQATQATAQTPQAPQAPQQGQEPQEPQEPQAPPESEPPANPEQTLAQVFKTMAFSNPQQATAVLNNAMKSAGNVPGMQEFFSSLAFDSNKGFMTAQQG